MNPDIKWERHDGILIAVLAGRNDGSNADVLQGVWSLESARMTAH